MSKENENSIKSISFEIDEIINLYASYVDINVELGDYFNNLMRELELIVKFDSSNLLIIDDDIVEELKYKDGSVTNRLYRSSDIDEAIYTHVINSGATRVKKLGTEDKYNIFSFFTDTTNDSEFSHIILPIIYNDKVVAIFSISDSTYNISDSIEEVSVYIDFLKLRVVNRLQNNSTRLNEEIVYALDYITDGYFILTGDLVTLSKKAQKIFKLSEPVVELQQIITVLKPESAHSVTSTLGKRLEVMTLVLHTIDDTVLEVDSFLINLRNKNDMRISIINDVTNEKKKLDRYESLAFIDSLTKLKNYNSLMDCFNKIGDDEDLTIINFDINKFKLINDTNGHNIGDVALIFFGMGLINAYKDLSNNVFRKSGDEFIIILDEEVTKEQMIDAFNRLSEYFDDSQNYPSNLPVKLEYSAGVASSSETRHNKNDLFKFADIAMYEAKKNNEDIPYVFFDDARYKTYVAEKSKIDHVTDAIQNDKIEIGYKSIMCTDGSIHGYKIIKNISDGDISSEDITKIVSKKDLLFKFEKKVLEKVLLEQSEVIKSGKSQFEIQIPICVDFLIVSSFYKDILRLTKEYNLSPSLITFVVVDLNSSTKIENVVDKLNQYIKDGYTLTYDFKTTEYPNTYYLKLLDFAHYSAPTYMLNVLKNNDVSRDSIYLRTLFYALIDLKIEPIFEDISSNEEISLLIEHNVKYFTDSSVDDVKTILDIIHG